MGHPAISTVNKAIKDVYAHDDIVCVGAQCVYIYMYIIYAHACTRHCKIIVPYLMQTMVECGDSGAASDGT